MLIKYKNSVLYTNVKKGNICFKKMGSAFSLYFPILAISWSGTCYLLHKIYIYDISNLTSSKDLPLRLSDDLHVVPPSLVSLELAWSSYSSPFLVRLLVWAEPTIAFSSSLHRVAMYQTVSWDPLVPPSPKRSVAASQ